jgi:hypothetical protein
MHLMAKRRRKTLVICRRCHEDIHEGRAATPTRNDHRRGRCGSWTLGACCFLTSRLARFPLRTTGSRSGTVYRPTRTSSRRSQPRSARAFRPSIGRSPAIASRTTATSHSRPTTRPCATGSGPGRRRSCWAASCTGRSPRSWIAGRRSRSPGSSAVPTPASGRCRCAPRRSTGEVRRRAGQARGQAADRRRRAEQDQEHEAARSAAGWWFRG